MKKIICFLMAIGLLSAACGGAPTPAPPTIEPPTEPAPTATQIPVDCDGECQAPIMAAIKMIDGAGFHGMSGDLAAAEQLLISGPVTGVTAAIDLINGTGFHGIQEEIEAAASMEEVNPRYLGSVTNALWVSRAAPWPEDLTAGADGFEASVQALAAALEAGDLESAQAEAAEAHHTQHSLSDAAFEWLGGQAAASDEGVLAAAGAVAAIDLINSTGFHGMAEEIEAAANMEDVNPRFLGSVVNALRVSGAAPWSADLAVDRAAFEASAESLAEALETGDLEAAKEAVAEVHHTQHSFSESVFEWLGDSSVERADGLMAVIGATAAIDLINNAGFHGMAEEIESATSIEEVNPRFLGSVENAMIASRAAPWPAEVADQVVGFDESIDQLVEALSEGDLEAAKEASADVHHTQHELSGRVFAWLSEQSGSDLLEGLVNPRFLGAVTNASAVVAATPWFGELSGMAASLQEELQHLAAALSEGDVHAAAESSHAVHEVQHELSHHTYGWLNSQVETAGDTGAVMAALNIIDSTGFHGMQEEIAAAASMEEVNPRNLGRVENALTVAQVVIWPDVLEGAANAFMQDASGLAEGLSASDLETAQEYAERLHASQHDLSHEAHDWLGAGADASAGLGALLVALDGIDSAGFHGMAEEIGAAGRMEDVNPRHMGTVQDVLTLTSAASWPPAVSENLDVFMTDTVSLVEALSEGDLEKASEAAEAIHHSQHDLSHAVYAWLTDEFSTDVVLEAHEDSDEHADEEASELGEEYADAERVRLEVRDWEWDPTTVTLTAGQPVVLEVTNTGALPHGIWIPALGVNVATPPGETVLVPLTPEEVGEYMLGCGNEMCGSQELHEGMKATVIVTGG